MIRKLLRRKSIEVWVVKQIDEDVLHLCGIGTPQTEQKRKAVIEALERGDYRGGVRIGKTGVVLNSRLFAALIPLEALTLEHERLALWQDRTWQISRVPQRCWHHEGRLIAHLDPLGNHSGLVSSEDVSTIRDSIDPATNTPATVEFRPGDALEDPTADIHEAIHQARARRHTKDKGWRDDGTWGTSPKPPEGSDP
ncbi:hypothetical protein [Halomonas heilongjiangensis]|uniref:Uncharacterized protein n=1 Tax=Halomonas heilongjiangensis TaxID=1387883 RepID=A0A2N7TJG2_9GAMM|nr:hypothetical protein [Halomonas heilongjiangensis]PMR68324.1 hypothetical protein C1H66_15625 [Halomonas heilongjiangensis]PXX89058.1 hypothetical protein CR158_11695 [Halomonas heilongjiangensis]